MNILVTGSNGFVGKNFIAALKAVKEGKDRVHNGSWSENLEKLNIYEYDIYSTQEELNYFCEKSDFVFNLAGVNRPENPEDFMNGNYGFASLLLDTLKKYNNKCPVILSSSIQATLEGRFADSQYGKSKLAGEELFTKYGQDVGAKILIYRLPNLFGKWCRPNYNSAVATFCNNIANDIPIHVNNYDTILDLVYIDDLIEEFFNALNGNENRDEKGYCFIKEVSHITLGEIVELLYSFKESRKTLDVPYMTEGSFSKKLYSTYLSYLNVNDFSYKLKMNTDDRGSFTEILRTLDRGQVSVNISKPEIIKGQHWHHTKNEKFIVVSGEGLIQLRKIGLNPETGKKYPVIDYPVNGEEITVVDMIPGYTHNIINCSKTENLVTVMWCNECFNKDKPDTFFEEV